MQTNASSNRALISPSIISRAFLARPLTPALVDEIRAAHASTRDAKLRLELPALVAYGERLLELPSRNNDDADDADDEAATYFLPSMLY